MAATTYRGVVRGGVVVFEHPQTPLADGTEVAITPIPIPGTSAAVLEALAHAPAVPVEWVDELERLIDGGRRAASQIS